MSLRLCYATFFFQFLSLNHKNCLSISKAQQALWKLRLSHFLSLCLEATLHSSPSGLSFNIIPLESTSLPPSLIQTSSFFYNSIAFFWRTPLTTCYNTFICLIVYCTPLPKIVNCQHRSHVTLLQQLCGHHSPWHVVGRQYIYVWERMNLQQEIQISMA